MVKDTAFSLDSELYMTLAEVDTFTPQPPPSAFVTVLQKFFLVFEVEIDLR